MTRDERAGAELFAAVLALPAWFLVGFYCGLWTGDLGPDRTIHAILLRALLCGIPTMLAVWLIRHLWVIPSAVYLVGFLIGYALLEGLGEGIAIVVMGMMSALSFGLIRGETPQPSPILTAELGYVVGIAGWMTLFLAVLLRHRRKRLASERETGATGHDERS